MTTYGKLMERRNHDGLLDSIKTAFVPRRRGLDLDVLRMYLRWRGLSLGELRNNPGQYRDPESLPSSCNRPTDGGITADTSDIEFDTEEAVIKERDIEGAEDIADPWGASEFFEVTEAYGTSAETLRHGLDHIVSEDDFWVTPGIPFLVPLFFGIVAAFIYGGLVSGVMRFLGLV
jgi:preflagellin peptidase FlaK